MRNNMRRNFKNLLLRLLKYRRKLQRLRLAIRASLLLKSRKRIMNMERNNLKNWKNKRNKLRTKRTKNNHLHQYHTNIKIRVPKMSIIPQNHQRPQRMVSQQTKLKLLNKKLTLITNLLETVQDHNLNPDQSN